MKRTYKEDHKLMDLLKLNEISRIICDTNMGTLKLRIRKGEKEYRFVLDSVELDKATNKEVFELLYPPAYSTKFEIKGDEVKIEPGSIKVIPVKEIKPKGRPKGTKNKKVDGKAK